LTDRAGLGSQQHLITKAQGIPVDAILTGANKNDVTQLEALAAVVDIIRRFSLCAPA